MFRFPMLQTTSVPLAAHTQRDRCNHLIFIRRRTLAALCVAALWHCGQALAAPSSMQVCTQVLDNADANATEGGDWSYAVANQSVTFQLPLNTRNESSAASPAACATAASVPVGSSSLSVLQTTDAPANWLRNAPGYPQWTITDGTHTINGSGASAALDASTFAQFTGAAKVTFTNASGRLVKSMCAAVKDNGSLPNAQSVTSTLTTLALSTSLSASEGGAAQCDTTFRANIPIGATSLGVSEATSLSMLSGYPQVQATGTTGTSPVSALSLSSGYTGTASLSGTAGDVTLTFTDEIDPGHSIKICKSLLDNSDGISQSGIQTMSYANGFALALTVNEGAPTTCTPAQAIGSGVTSTPVRELLFPGTFIGFASGYPQWTIADATTSATLLTGSGTVADVDWSNPAFAAAQNLMITFTDKAGAFGDGALPNTGSVARICKRVLDNADGVQQAGNFSFAASWSDAVLSVPSVTSTSNSTEGTLTCPSTLARWPNDNTVAVFEAFSNANWPGEAPGFPKAQVFALANPSATDVPSSSAQMAFGSPNTPFGNQYAATLTAAPGDISLVVQSEAGGGAAPQPQTVTFCLHVNDNGLAPANDGGTWNFGSPATGSVLATEGSSTLCVAPIALPDPNSTAWSGSLGQNVIVPATWPGFDVIAGGSPFAAYPYVQYNATAGGTGNLSATASFSASGNQMFWSAPQSFFKGIGNVTVTFIAQASARYQVCAQVLQNGDAVNDSSTFTLNNQQSLAFLSSSVSASEGGGPACAAVARFPSLAAIIASETLPASWNSANDTAGFPQWNIDSAGPAPVHQTGSGLSTSGVPQAPAAQQGDTTITFSNRLGAMRFATFCTQLTDNADGSNDTAAIQLAATSNDPAAPNLGNYALSSSETAGMACGAPVVVPNFATQVEAAEVLPSGFVSQTGYPQWAVLDSSGVTVLQGAGVDTHGLTRTAIDTPNFTVLLKNLKADNADVAIAATGPGTVVAGAQLSYQISVSNAGPYPAPAVTLSDTAPAGLSFVSVSGCASLPCNLGSLGVGSNRTLTVTYSVPPNYVLANGISPLLDTFSVSTTTIDTQSANNASTVSTTVTASADVSIVAQGPASVVVNTPVTYTLVIANAGASSADSASFADDVPATISAVSASCGSPMGGAVCGAVSVAGNHVSGQVATLPPSGNVTITIRGTAPATPSSLTDTATVQAPASANDPVAANNTSSVGTSVTAAGPDLAVSVDNGAGYLQGGTLADITITVHNLNGVDATGAKVAAVFPSNLVNPSWTCQATGNAQCTNGTGNINATVNVPAGQSIVYSVTGTVSKLPEFPLVTSVTATPAVVQTDVDTSNNSATAATPVGIFADGFELTGLGAKQFEVGSAQGVEAESIGVDVAKLSTAPRLVAVLSDGKVSVTVHVKSTTTGALQARLALQYGDASWQVQGWKEVADPASLILAWDSSRPSEQNAPGTSSELLQVELHDANGRIASTGSIGHE